MLKVISKHSRLRNFIEILSTAALYFILARLSLLLQFQSSNATPVWPPSGFAFAMILLLGYRIIPGIMLGAFAANVLIFHINKTAALPESIVLSFFISIGNTAESIAGYYLLHRMIPKEAVNNFFLKVNHIFRFSFTAPLMCLVSCFVGATTNLLAGIISSDQYPAVLITWWLGDVSGVLLLTSFILIWVKFFQSEKSFISGDWKRKTEVVIFFLAVLIASGIVFDNWIFSLFIFRWAFWMIPVLMWCALRFNQHKTISAVVLCSAIAIWGTINRHGPFSLDSLNESLLTIQAFISIITITQLALNASVMERKQTEERLRITGAQLEIRVKERTAELVNIAGELTEKNRELQQQKEFVETILDSAEDQICVYDKEGRFLAINKKCADLTGIPPRQAIGKKFEEVFPAFVNTPVHEGLQKALNGETIPDQIFRSEYSNRIYSNFYIPLKKHNEVYGAVIIAHDNTEIIAASQKVEEANVHLEEKNKELEEMNRELTSFSYIASHDLQEPLRKIQMFTKRILEKEIEVLSENGKEYFNRMQKASERMQQLILDLLMYSRTNTSEKHYEKTDLNILAGHVKNELAEKITETNAVIEVSCLPRLNVIPFQFHQLFTNILSNSLKFANPHIPPRVFIKADIVESDKINGANIPAGKKYHRISIIDNGIGFEPEHNKQIFELFQRLHARNEYDGTGIGLAICKKIVENHNGFITANGEPGKGATFNIYLPIEENDNGTA